MNYLAIEDGEIQNGIGIGTTLYVSGCEHHCKKCFNKESWNKHNGTEFTKDTLAKLLNALKGKRRLTISGGDPFAKYNIGRVLTIVDEVKKVYPDITVWVFTGYKLMELPVKSLSKLSNIDYIVDGKYDENFTHLLPFRGSDNQVVWNYKNGSFKKVNKWH